MRGHCGSDCWRLSSRVLLTYLEMMPVSGRLCLKTSYLEGINWIPSVSFCVHVQQLNADYVIAEAQQAMSHELLMAFHSVCTTLCQCCACEPPRSTNWSQRPSFIDSIWVIFLDLCVCVCVCVFVCVCLNVFQSLPWQQQTNRAAKAGSHLEKHLFWHLSRCHSDNLWRILAPRWLLQPQFAPSWPILYWAKLNF